MKKALILIHWKNQLVVHSTQPIDSDHHRDLLKKGYVVVGELKEVIPERIYWDGRYFSPQDKYIANPTPPSHGPNWNMLDEVTT